MPDQLKIGSLFSGAGGLDLAVEAAFGARTVWQVEFDKNASKVLAARFPDAPNYHDVTTVSWGQGLWDDGTQDGGDIEMVDILCGGFPCQDVSSAGLRAGLKDGTRSGLWSYFAEAIDAIRPQFVVIENVRGLLTAEAARVDAEQGDSDVEPGAEALGDGDDGHILRAAGAVLGDLATLGYDASWKVVPASAIGAPHERERVFILAYPTDVGPEVFNDGTWRAEAYRRALRGDAAGGDSGHDGHPAVDLLPTPDAGVFTRGSEHMMLPHIVRLAVGDDTVPNPGLAGAPKAAPPLLPTPLATGDRGDGHQPSGLLDVARAVVGQPHPIGGHDVKLLPTPNATEADRGNGGNKTLMPDVARAAVTTPEPSNGDGCDDGPGDPDDIFALLPTPTAHDGKSGTGGWETHTGGPSLPEVIEQDPKLFPTPTALASTRAGQPPEVRKSYGIGVSIVEMIDVATTYGSPEWHQYDAAIRRWERLFRPAPYPVVAGNPNAKHGMRPQLSAEFDEWMMGWPEGWTDVGLSRRQRLKICGNGVVPQQAEWAVRWMLAELAQEIEGKQ